MRAPPLVLLMALARQVTHFLVHHQVHQLQPGLPQQVSYSLLQQTDDVGHRKDHLHVGILLGGEPAELLHGSLLFDLISFLHSDSLLFSWQKNNRRPIMAASLRVAYFLRIYRQSRVMSTPWTLFGAEQSGAYTECIGHRHSGSSAWARRCSLMTERIGRNSNAKRLD